MIDSGVHQRDSVIHIHVSILPKLLSHPGCHIILSRVPAGFCVFIFFLYFLFTYLWLCWVFVAAHGLFLVAVRGSYSLVAKAVHGFFIAVASLVVA